MSAAVAALVADADKGIIAAYRYLAFLDQEKRFLVHELYPDRATDDGYFVPCDNQVNALMDTSPLERAALVLEALDIDPYTEDDGWIECLRNGGVAAFRRLASQLRRPRRAS